MNPGFNKKLLKLHLARMAFGIITVLTGAFGRAVFVLAVIGLLDAASGLDYTTRLLVLIAVAANFFRETAAGVKKLFSRAVAKTCLISGEAALSAWRLYSFRDKLISLGISGELISDAVAEGEKQIEKLRFYKLLAVPKAPLILLAAGAVAVFFNPVSSSRVFLPRKQNISEFMKIEAPTSAVRGEPWEARVWPRPGIKPLVWARGRGGEWAKKKTVKKDGIYHFKVESCNGPFDVKFGWKNVRSGIYNVRVLSRPEILKVSLLLEYPSYLKLPPRRTDYGSVSAFKGTRVNVTLACDEPLERADLTYVSKGVETKSRMKVSGTAAHGSFTVSGPGRWHADLFADNGLRSTEPVCWDVTPATDEPPVAEMFQPDSDLFITDSFRELKVRWWAGDDFGVRAVYFCRQKNDGPTEKTRLFEGYVKEKKGEYLWKISGGMKPGDTDAVWILAADAAGRLGESRRVSITLKDFMLSHGRTMALEKEVKDEIFERYKEQAKLNAVRAAKPNALLADRQAELEKALERLADKTGALVSRMEEDPLSNSFFSSEYAGIQKSLERAARLSREARESFAGGNRARGMEKQDEVLSSLERLSVLSEDLFKRSSMDNIENLGRSSEEVAKKLEDALSSSDIKAKSRELASLTRRIGEMMKQIVDTLKNMPKNLPEEFVNSDSLKKVNFGNVSDSLKGVNDAIASGNVDEAIKRARQLLESLKKMRAALASAAGEVPGMASSSAGEEKRGLGEIIQEEENIASATARVVERHRRAIAASNAEKAKIIDNKALSLRKAAEKMWNNRRLEFGRDAGALSGGLYEFDRNAGKGLDIYLKRGFGYEKNFKGMSAAIEKMKTLSVSTDSLKKITALEDKMNDFFSAYSDTSVPAVSAQDRDFMTEISSMQTKTAVKTDELAKKLYEYSRGSAQFPAGIIDNIRKARREMEGASGALNSFAPEKAAASEDRALYYLKKSQEAMGSYSYTPMPSPGSGSMPSFMPAGASGMMPGASGSSGSRGFRQQSFEIPVGSERKFNEFLKDLNDARKMPAPEKYREMLKDYYDQLSR